MIHDGDYYSIVDKDKILSLLDEIEQNIIWLTTENSYDTILCSQYLWARILILQRKWRALSGIEDCPCEAFRNATETFYSGSWIVLHKSGILMMLQINPIWSMMEIIIALSIRTRSYCCWMVLSRISYYFPLKIHMIQYYALKISGTGSWYYNVNGEHYQV